MSNVCDQCGQSNRPTAMFCIGCTGKLPSFAPSGPSALEAAQATRPKPLADATTPALPSETKSFWLVLVALGVAMMIGFMAWFLRVTEKPTVTVASSPVQTTQRSAPPSASKSVTPSSAPQPVVQDRAASAPATNVRPPAPVAAPRDAGRDAQVQAVEKFYRALAAADGRAAAAAIVPAKRGIGPFNETSMSKFYGSFERPLVIRSIRPIDARLVEARYSYRVSKTTCEGTAIVETERVSQETLIRSIRANC
jgi:hypothetical protein